MSDCVWTGNVHLAMSQILLVLTGPIHGGKATHLDDWLHARMAYCLPIPGQSLDPSTKWVPAIIID